MQTQQIFSLVYVSSAVKPFTNDELVSLLKKCRENNTRVNVTGMLVYKEANFMQALEGDEATIKGLRDRIRVDPRHKGFIELISGVQQQRDFADWSMGFTNIDEAVLPAMPGFSDFLDTPLTASEFKNDPSRARRLLLTFKQIM